MVTLVLARLQFLMQWRTPSTAHFLGHAKDQNSTLFDRTMLLPTHQHMLNLKQQWVMNVFSSLVTQHTFDLKKVAQAPPKRRRGSPSRDGMARTGNLGLLKPVLLKMKSSVGLNWMLSNSSNLFFFHKVNLQHSFALRAVSVKRFLQNFLIHTYLKIFKNGLSNANIH